MKYVPAPSNKSERLKGLLPYQTSDSGRVTFFDIVVRFAAHLSSGPFLFTTIVEWFKTKVDTRSKNVSGEAPANGETVLEREQVVEGASEVKYFRKNNFSVKESGMQFYDGFPLYSLKESESDNGSLKLVKTEKEQRAEGQSVNKLEFNKLANSSLKPSEPVLSAGSLWLET
ncbi:hypothetical protein, partial [Pontibacter silvestris]